MAPVMHAIRGTRRRLAASVVAASLSALVLGNVAAALPVRDAAAGSGPVTVVSAAPTDAHIRLALRASGLTKPTFATSAHDSTGRLFVVEQTGRIKIYQSGKVLSTPFLNIASQVSGGNEQGLLGLAFHPSFKTNHKLYVDFTDVNGNTVIREYRVSSTNPNVVATSTARTILRISQPYDNHNGGMLAFGADGYLYIGMGDGGSGGDPGNRAQSIYNKLGKILRIDVNGTTSKLAYRIPPTNPYATINGYDEIWQLGVRNPWRFSFDRANGNLYIGDVGQSAWEEVDRAVKTSTGAGRGTNWGWHVLEGFTCYSPPSGCDTSGLTMPVLAYDHGNGRCAVTGGYVSRGSVVPALKGGYVFGDFCSGEIWVIDATAASPAKPVLLLDTSLTISSFGENQAGDLYVLDHDGGKLYAILPA
jgi:glucose/arabinose dehydrogenase